MGGTCESLVVQQLLQKFDRLLTETAQEQGRFPPHRLTDPPTPSMGRFCLTVQALILLGKVLRHVNDNSGEEYRSHEAKVLDNTIAALTTVSLQEGRSRGFGVCSPTTICFRYGE
jgi:hypothetical protein